MMEINGGIADLLTIMRNLSNIRKEQMDSHSKTLKFLTRVRNQQSEVAEQVIDNAKHSMVLANKSKGLHVDILV